MAIPKDKLHISVYEEDDEAYDKMCIRDSGYARLSSLLRAKREPEKHPLLSRRGRDVYKRQVLQRREEEEH